MLKLLTVKIRSKLAKFRAKTMCPMGKWMVRSDAELHDRQKWSKIKLSNVSIRNNKENVKLIIIIIFINKIE